MGVALVVLACRALPLTVQLQPFGLTTMQCLFLEALWEEEGLSVGEIGRRIILDTATLAGILDRLVTAGWVRREADKQDGRVARVFLTNKARSVKEEMASAIERLFDGMCPCQPELIIFLSFTRK